MYKNLHYFYLIYIFTMATMDTMATMSTMATTMETTATIYNEHDTSPSVLLRLCVLFKMS